MSTEHYADSAPCPGCGQVGYQLGPGVVCNRCMRAQYGGDEHHESPRLFEPAPMQLPGQMGLDSDE